MRLRPLQPLQVEPDAVVLDAGLFPDAVGPRVRVGHLRHPFGADEGDELDRRQAGVRQGVDEGDLVRRGDGRLLELEALARTHLADADLLGHVAHRLSPCMAPPAAIMDSISASAKPAPASTSRVCSPNLGASRRTAKS